MSKYILMFLLAGWLIILGAIIALAFTGHFTHASQLLLVPFTMFGALLTILEINDLGDDNV